MDLLVTFSVFDSSLGSVFRASVKAKPNDVIPSVLISDWTLCPFIWCETLLFKLEGAWVTRAEAIFSQEKFNVEHGTRDTHVLDLHNCTTIMPKF